MRCTQSSMELVSSVIGFDIVELWTEDSEDHKLRCTYVHAEENLVQRYPGIIVGHYPNHKKQHILSPRLCALARSSSTRCHWEVLKEDDPATKAAISNSRDAGIERGLHPGEMSAPVKTEMAYLLEETEETSGMGVYIVGFALDRIEFNAKKLKFISGIGFAIFVAAFDLDEDDYPSGSAGLSAEGVGGGQAELDVKTFFPGHFQRRT